MIYKDKSKSVSERVEDLLQRMTLEEKAAQLCGDLAFNIITDGKFDYEKVKERFSDGHGRITQFSIVGLSNPMDIAQIANELQRFFIEETRLGIPVALQTENLSGYPAAEGTVFPSMLNIASTWEPELARRMSEIIGEESKAVGCNSAMSPVIDVSRDPRWGRTYETFGEDHYLISQFGINYVAGMQSKGVSCIAKHFLGYSETQGGLNTATTRLNDRELYEVFATPFEAAAKEAGLGGMMASYSEINGLPVGANKDIARKLLRDTMGFEGMLTSDGGGIAKMHGYFNVAKTYKEAGLIAKKGGLDTEIPIGGAYRQLPDYVRAGELDESLLDESVRRVLTIKFDVGLFDDPYIDVEKLGESMTNKDKQIFSEELALKSITLLKNDGVLPIAAEKKIAVIGPHGDNLRYPISGYTYPAYLEMSDESKQTGEEGAFDRMFAMFSDEQRANMDDMKTLLNKMGASTLQEALGERFNVTYAKGCDIVDENTNGFQEALALASDADVIVMALGGNCGWINVTGGEGKDRARLDLPGVQQELLEAVKKVGKPIVMVLYGPGVFAIPWAKDNIEGIIQAFMPGPYAGKVLRDIIAGDQSPQGKLPVTVPRSVGQVPCFYNHKVGSGFSAQPDPLSATIFSGGYVDEDDEPLFPFGHGLSYSEFDVYDCDIKNKDVDTDEGQISVTCKIKNIGGVRASEVVQLYYYFEDARVVRPNKQLAGFAKVELDPNDEKKVTVEVPTKLLGFYNEDMDFVVEPGSLKIMLGTSSKEIIYEETIRLTGKKINLLGKRKYSSISRVE